MSQFVDESESRAANFRHWLKQRMQRENLFGSIRTFSWLAPLTLLIWVYAERAQVITVENQTIPIDVQIADPNRFVRLDMPGNDKGNVVARLSGPRSRVDDLVHRITPVDNKPTVVIFVDSSVPVGQESELDAAQYIRLTRVFQSSGVSISDCKPQRLRVWVDEFVTKEMDVKVPPSLADRISSASFTPAKVMVRAPKTYFDDVTPQGSLMVNAVLPSSMLVNPGNQEGNVRLVCPQIPEANVTFSPDMVKASLEVNSSDAEAILTGIPIIILATNNILDQYRVNCDATIPDLKVIGPPDKIALLKGETPVKPLAVLHVSGEDRTNATAKHSRKAEIKDLPEGVRVAPGQSTDIAFTLSERSAAQ